MKYFLIFFVVFTSCNITGPKYGESSANKKTASNSRHFTDSCKPLLADKYYYWPIEESENMFVCDYEGKCFSLELSEIIIKDNEFELIFSEDKYLCKIKIQ